MKKEMKCKKTTLLMLTLAFTLVLMTAVMATAKPSTGNMALIPGGPEHTTYGIPGWSGPITGDINGYIYFFYLPESKAVGQAYFFWEIFLITNGDANGYGDTVYLMGADSGVVTWKNNKYRMNGVITEANSPYEDLIDCNYHMSGYITWDNGVPLTAPGIFRIN
jgi:hypothetical protein